MDRTIYAHLKLIPTSFPEHVTIQYRVADPKSNSFTGEAYEANDSWTHIRKTYIVTEDELDEVEEHLKAGQAANFGFHYVSGEFPSVNE